MIFTSLFIVSSALSNSFIFSSIFIIFLRHFLWSTSFLFLLSIFSFIINFSFAILLTGPKLMSVSLSVSSISLLARETILRRRSESDTGCDSRIQLLIVLLLSWFAQAKIQNQYNEFALNLFYIQRYNRTSLISLQQRICNIPYYLFVMHSISFPGARLISRSQCRWETNHLTFQFFYGNFENYIFILKIQLSDGIIRLFTIFNSV